MGFDPDLLTGDVYEFDLVRETLAVEVHSVDLKSSGHGDRLREKLSFGTSDVPDVLEEALDSAVYGGDLRIGVPEVVDQFQGVKRFWSTIADG